MNWTIVLFWLDLWTECFDLWEIFVPTDQCRIRVCFS